MNMQNSVIWTGPLQLVEKTNSQKVETQMYTICKDQWWFLATGAPKYDSHSMGQEYFWASYLHICILYIHITDIEKPQIWSLAVSMTSAPDTNISKLHTTLDILATPAGNTIKLDWTLWGIQDWFTFFWRENSEKQNYQEFWYEK